MFSVNFHLPGPHTVNKDFEAKVRTNERSPKSLLPPYATLALSTEKGDVTLFIESLEQVNKIAEALAEVQMFFIAQEDAAEAKAK